MPPKNATSNQPASTTKSSPLHTYHSDVMQAMCSQMVHHRRKADAPLPLAKKPDPSSTSTTSAAAPAAGASTKKAQCLTEHVQSEMARRAKADRVLQDLSSDKSRQQARARETARRSKWAKSVAPSVPHAEVPVMKRQLSQYKNFVIESLRRRPSQVS